MPKEFITQNPAETQALGRQIAKSLKGGEVICLSGELGAGKTTFTQGFLEEFGAEGPYTSPTFVIMKAYDLNANGQKLKAIYHFDAYRVGLQDISNLGWHEIIADPKNVVIIEWAEKVRDIIPPNAWWINFTWRGKDERKVVISL